MAPIFAKSGTSVAIYQNGVWVSSGNGANNTRDDILSAFEIGGYRHRNWIDSNVRTRLTGLVDDVRIYAGGLTADEVTALYQGGAADGDATGTGAVATSGERTFADYTGKTLAEQKAPIVYLRMDETGIVKDYSGNGIDAEATDYVTKTANKSAQENRALYFDGRSHVEQTKLSLSKENTAWLSAQINATGKMTVSFWMNADFENSHRMSILGIYDKSGRPMGTFETRGTLGQDVWMDGRFAIAFTAAKPYGGSGVIDEKTYEQLAVTATTPTYDNEFDNRNDKHYGDKQIDTWYHIVGELDSTTNKLRLYLNGALVQEIDIAAGTLGEIGYFLVGQPAGRYYQYENASNGSENGDKSGRQGWAMRDGFVGTVDEIKVYNTILSADEVKALYDTSVEGHTLSAVAEKPATCTETGVKAHWKCDECGKLFTDANALHETTEAKLVIEAKGHKLTEVKGAPATCTEAGKKAYWKCSVCQKIFSDAEGKNETTEAELVIPANGHKLTEVKEVPATCTETGKKAYWKCSVCQRIFSDAEGKNETTEAELIIPAAGHDFTVKTVSEKTLRSAATYAEKATYWYTCSVCGALSDTLHFEDGEVLKHEIKGDESWMKGTKTGVTITVDDESVTGVQIDGKALSDADYTLKGKKLTIKAEVLEKLSVGKHTVTVTFEAGSADCNLTVKVKPATPTTGDSGNLLAFVILGFSAAGAAALTLLAQKRRKTN